MQKIDWVKLVVFVLVCQMAGVIGGFFTASAIPAWYAGLSKPFFSPPNWVFGPVWITLYALMGISAYLIWEKRGKNSKVWAAMDLFAGQLILNTTWSILFFGFQSPLYGLVCIVFLWLAIAMTIASFYSIDRRAAYLLVPYVLWVSFAAILNFAIWGLNS